MTGADLDTRLRVGCRLRTHPLLDLAGHGQESLLDIGGILGRGLEEGNSEAVGELLMCMSETCSLVIVSHMVRPAYLGDRVLDDLLVRHIALVAHQQLVHALGGIAVNLLQPLLDVVEAVHVGDIVDDTNAVSSSVV